MPSLPEYIPYFLPAAWMTLEITVLGILLGLVLGLVTVFMRISDKRILNLPAHAYIYIIRGTPLLLQLLFIYFGMRSLVGAVRSSGCCSGFGNS